MGACYWARKILDATKIILKIVKAGIFQRFMAQMEMENKQNSLDHLLMLIFPDALYEGSGGDFIPYATEWKSRLPYAKLDVDYLTIDLTDLKARIDEALAPVMSRRMSRGAA